MNDLHDVLAAELVRVRAVLDEARRALRQIANQDVDPALFRQLAMAALVNCAILLDE